MRHEKVLKSLCHALYVATDRAVEFGRQLPSEQNKEQFLALVRQAFEQAQAVLPDDEDIKTWISWAEPGGRWSKR